MARLSDAALSEGKQHLINKDLDGLDRWIDEYKIRVNKSEVRETMQRCLLAGDLPRALRLFDAAFSKVDPELELRVQRVLGAVILFVLVGALLGFVSLIIFIVQSCS